MTVPPMYIADVPTVDSIASVLGLNPEGEGQISVTALANQMLSVLGIAELLTVGPGVLRLDASLGLNRDAVDDVALAIQTPAGGLGRGIIIDHYASGVGQYALDIHMYKNAGADDANSAIAVHNYSATATAVIIDSTDQQTLLALNNSENPVTSPGTKGTGPFISFSGYGGSSPNTRRNLGYISGQLQLAANYNDVPWSVVTGLNVIQGPSGVTRALEVIALNPGYAQTITGTDSGLSISTTGNGGNGLTVIKNGSGAGTAAIIANAGTGASLLLTDGAFATKFRIDYLGRVVAPAMPTSNPGITGMLWSDGGTIKIV